MSTDQKPKSSARDKALIVIFSLIIAISLLGVAGVYLLTTDFFVDEGGGDEGVSRAPLNSGVTTPPEAEDKSTTFLVAGIDYTTRAGNERGHLTDVLMLVNFDIEGKNVDVLRIPRDTYIGDYTTNRIINGVYGQKGGINGLMNKLNAMFQLPIDHYVTIDMDGFVAAIDKIGGVEVDVPLTFDLEGYHIEKGLQTLDGIRAEKLVRERKSYANADLGRIQTQQIFLEALIKKAFSLGAGEIAALAPTLLNYVSTDLNLADMLGCYNDLMKLSPSDIRFHLLPVAGAEGNTKLSILRRPTADLLNAHFRPYLSPVSAEQLDVIELVKDYEYSSAP